LAKRYKKVKVNGKDNKERSKNPLVKRQKKKENVRRCFFPRENSPADRRGKKSGKPLATVIEFLGRGKRMGQLH